MDQTNDLFQEDTTNLSLFCLSQQHFLSRTKHFLSKTFWAN